MNTSNARIVELYRTGRANWHAKSLLQFLRLDMLHSRRTQPIREPCGFIHEDMRRWKLGQLGWDKMSLTLTRLPNAAEFIPHEMELQAHGLRHAVVHSRQDSPVTNNLKLLDVILLGYLVMLHADPNRPDTARLCRDRACDDLGFSKSSPTRALINRSDWNAEQLLLQWGSPWQRCHDVLHPLGFLSSFSFDLS